MSLVEHALKYEKLCWFVLPIHPVEKRPLTKWAYRKDQLPTPDEIRDWFQERPDARIGIATGSLSGVDVVDLDGPQARERFEALFGIPGTIMQSTGRAEGGLHLFFKHNGNGLKCCTGKDENKGIDLRTDGGIVVLAPSPHKSGNHYQWFNINPIEDGLDDLLDMPTDVIEHFKNQNCEGQKRKPITTKPVERGARNDTLTRLVGKWISNGMDRETVILAADGWNGKLPEPLNDKEVVTTVESVFRTHERNHPVVANIQNEKSLDFPIQVVTGAAGYFTNVYSDIVEAPAHFLFMGYLTCLGAAVSPHLTLNSVLNTQPRLFTVLLGESATERKSTTLNIVINNFKSILKQNFNVCWGVGSAEGLQKVLNKKAEHDERQPLGTLLSFDELKAFVSKCSIESSVLLPIVNTLFENNLYESHTKKQDINIEDAYLSLLAATTIATYERIYNSAFLDIGFPNRVFLVPGTAKRQHSIPSTISQSDSETMKQDLLKVLQHVGSGMELDLTPEARNIYHNWYMNLEPSVHSKRLDTYSLRLMMLLAVNNLKTVVDPETVEHAIALCDWQLDVRKTHDPIDADTKSAKMEESIRRALRKEPHKDYELKRAVNANRLGLWVYDMALKNLRKANEICWDKKNTKWMITGNL